MRNLGIVQLMRREISSALRFTPWLVVSLFVAAVLWRSDLTASSGLFQSPATPTVEVATPTSPPTEVPTAEPTVPPIAATPTTAASMTPSAADTLTQTVPFTATATATATYAPTASPTVAPATSTPLPSSTMGTSQPVATSDERYAEGDSNLKFDWSMLFDSIALGASYLWLCCGILVIASIPVVFMVLWVAGRRQRPEHLEPQEEAEEQEE